MRTSPPIVLVVEDQPLVRMSIEEGLQDRGYDVVVASSVADAMGTIETMGDAIGAVVTNVHVGRGPGGWEVARRSRDVNPTIPVVYTTTSPAADRAARAVSNGVVLAMPYRIEQMAKVLARLLEEAAALAHQA